MGRAIRDFADRDKIIPATKFLPRTQDEIASGISGQQHIERVAELADKRGVSMTEISLAWLLTKVTAPVVGATKLNHIDGAAKEKHVWSTGNQDLKKI